MNMTCMASRVIHQKSKAATFFTPHDPYVAELRRGTAKRASFGISLIIPKSRTHSSPFAVDAPLTRNPFDVQ